jgi:uncharacterized protein (TIGR03663 family)
VNERKIPWIEIGIIVLAVVLRLAWLDIKPAHFDEGINGWFADQMLRNGYYHYDPTNYHGPLHFYAVFISQTLFGRNLWALRLPAIIASLLAVGLMLRFEVFFGRAAARLAALALAISPAAVFYGRYSIHESWMLLFTMLATYGVLGLWQFGGRRYLFALITGFVGMVLTKETYLLHTVSLGLAGLTLWGWQRVIPSNPSWPVARASWRPKDLAWACGIGLFVIIFFYSGTFLDWPGLAGIYETFAAWFKTGVEAGGHEKTSYEWHHINYYWIALLIRYEAPALAGLLTGLLFIGATDARVRFLAIYSGGVLLAYSIIPYKTPWCIISILWPFLLIFGVVFTKKSWLLAISALLLLISISQCIRLNFFHYTDDKEPYVYVQTYKSIGTLTDPLLALAKKDPRFYHVSGQLLLDSYYPLPWILGDFSQVGYFSKENQPSTPEGDFIVVETSKTAEIEPKLTDSYYRRDFMLRDAQEECTVYFRKRTFDDWFKNEGPVVGPRP